MNRIYENLASAIILQAVKDWRDSVHRLKKRPKNEESFKLKAECEQFFLSDWFNALTPLDGRLILRKLEQEAEENDC